MNRSFGYLLIHNIVMSERHFDIDGFTRVYRKLKPCGLSLQYCHAISLTYFLLEVALQDHQTI